MSFCILRAKKLTSIGSICGSAKHTFREIPTPNADSSRTCLNWTSGAATSNALRTAILERLPVKRRKDAVLCIEYLITASPEWLDQAAPAARLAYFNRAIDWLKKRHGKENIVCLNLQRDERSEHLVAYVVPLTRDGRLSAKDFLGGRPKLSAMQSSFWAAAGKGAGLLRGLEGSTAKHTTAKQYSAALSKNSTLAPPLVPVPSLADRLSGRHGRLKAEYDAENAKYLRLIEQVKTDFLFGSVRRQQHIAELRMLREKVQELDGIEAKFRNTAATNVTLIARIKDQDRVNTLAVRSLRYRLLKATRLIKKLLTRYRPRTAVAPSTADRVPKRPIFRSR